jgi:hypothetical protein
MGEVIGLASIILVFFKRFRDVPALGEKKSGFSLEDFNSKKVMKIT